MSRFTFWPLSPEAEEEAAQLRAELAGLALLRAGHRLAALACKANFNRAEPRVPAGNPGGGRWTDGGGDTGYVRVAAAGDSERPPTVIAVPMYNIDPLDPKNINTPPTPAELEEAHRSLTAISKMDADTLARVGKGYKNYPDRSTGAALPPSINGYLSFPVGARSSSARRLLIDTSTGAVYYTNNHYRSFYHFNLSAKSQLLSGRR